MGRTIITTTVQLFLLYLFRRGSWEGRGILSRCTRKEQRGYRRKNNRCEVQMQMKNEETRKKEQQKRRADVEERGVRIQGKRAAQEENGCR